MPSLGLGLGLGFGGYRDLRAYQAESLTLFAAMTVAPSVTRRHAIDDLIAALKTAGAWTKLDRLYMLAAHDSQAAYLDWKTPGTDSLVATDSGGSLHYEKDRGVFVITTGASSAARLRNTVNVNAFTNFQQNNAHYSFWVTQHDGAHITMGTVSYGCRFRSRVSTQCHMALNGGLCYITPDQVLTDEQAYQFNGWMLVDRKPGDVGNLHFYRNGGFIGSNVSTSSAPGAEVIDILDGSNAASGKIAMVSFGADLDVEASAVHTALRAYMDSVGASRPFSGTAWSFDWVSNPSIESPDGYTPLAAYPNQNTVYDWEGTPIQTRHWEVAFSGYRRIENLLQRTTTLSTQTATLLSGSDTHVLSFTGTGTITYSGAASGSLVGQGASVRVSKQITTTTTSLVCTASVDVRMAQLEDVSYQSNKNPGEYVSHGDEVYPYHGVGRDGIKLFTTENGNTVSTELVTEAAGAALNPNTIIKGLDAWHGSNNVCLQSENFGTTWSAVGSPTRSAEAKHCGFIKLDLLGDDDGAALEGYTQNLAFTYASSARKGVSCFISEGTSTSTVIRLRDTTASADRLLATITWSGGLPVVAITTGEVNGTGYESLANGVFRVLLRATGVVIANTNQLQVYPATDNVLAIGNTGNVYVGGVQAEDMQIVTPYIPTTTVAVTRLSNYLHDQDSNRGLPWLSQSAGTAIVEAILSNSLDDGAGNDDVTGSGLHSYLWEAHKSADSSNNRWHMNLYPEASPNQNVATSLYRNGNNELFDAPDPLLRYDWANGEKHKLGIAWTTNDAANCFDGGAVDTCATVTPPVTPMNGVIIGNGNGILAIKSAINGYIRKFEYDQARRDNAALQADTIL